MKKKKLIMRIVAILVCVLIFAGVLFPTISSAEGETTETSNITTDESALLEDIVAIVSQPATDDSVVDEGGTLPTTNISTTVTENRSNFETNTTAKQETSNAEIAKNSVKTELSLNEIKDENADNIIIHFADKKDGNNQMDVLFTKTNGYKAVVYFTPGEYSIKFLTADNKREVQLESNVIEINEGGAASAVLTVKQVLDNNFIPKFFRNNTFILIVLVVLIIVYYVIRRKKGKGLFGKD